MKRFLFLPLAFYAFSNLFAQITVTNERSINSAFQEYSPAFYGKGLVFVAANPAVEKDKKEDTQIGRFTTSIFLAKRTPDGVLQRPLPFAEELTTKFYDGPMSFNATGDMVFFTRSNLKKGKPKVAKDGKVKLKIYTALLTNGQWTNITELPFCDGEADYAHPAVSADGRRLFFSSNRSGGQGGMDLYVSMNQNGIWGEPVNLGPKINTPKDEVFPFAHASGALFFSSNGRNGLGGLDIFSTKQTGNGWLPPTAFPETINSTSDDFGLILNEDRTNGYFASNRASGQGDDDIYNVSIPEGLEIISTSAASVEDDLFSEKPKTETAGNQQNTEGSQNTKVAEKAKQEAARIAEQKRIEEEKREATRLAELKRVEEQKREAARLGELKRVEEQKREEAKLAEQKIISEKKRAEAEIAEQKRQEADIAEQKRVKAEIAEAKRKEASIAEQKRAEARNAEQKREDARLAEEKKKEAKLAEQKREEDKIAAQKQAKIAADMQKREETRLAEEKKEEAKLAEQRLKEAKLAEAKREEAKTAELKREEEKMATAKREEEKREEAKLAEQKLAEQKREEEQKKEAIKRAEKIEQVRFAQQKREEARLAEQKLAEQKREEEQKQEAIKRAEKIEAVRLAQQKREEAKLSEQKNGEQKREEAGLVEAKIAAQKREEARLAEVKLAELKREETRLTEAKIADLKREEASRAEAKIAAQKREEAKIAEAKIEAEKSKTKPNKKRKNETQTKEETASFTTPKPIAHTEVTGDSKPVGQGNDGQNPAITTPIQYPSVVAPLALQNQNGAQTTVQNTNSQNTNAATEFGETTANYEQGKADKARTDAQILEANRSRKTGENQGFAPSESQNTEGYKYIETAIATFDKNSNTALQQVKVGVIAMKTLTNAVVVTDIVGKLIGLRTEDGNAIAIDELPQQTEMSNEKGRVKLPLIIGERYLFNFSKAGYEPKFILKTILANDNRVAALLVPEKLTNAKPRVAVVEKPKVETPKIAEKPIIYADNGYKTTPVETQNTTYSNKPNNTQYVERQPVIYNDNRTQSVDTNITYADSFSDVKMDMNRTLTQGQTFELRNIYYGYGDAELSQATKVELEPLVLMMQQDPEMVIEIAAHTDSRGKAPFNLNLSQLRADNIKSFLVEKDIAPERIKTIGYGETRLKNKCADNIDCTEQEHQINRRTEIRALKSGKFFDNKDSKKGIDVQQVGNTEGVILADVSTSPVKYLNNSATATRFLVIVGTYAKSANAEKQRQKVIASGFVETELVQFQGTALYGVCVRHFDNLKEAQSLSNYINAQKEFEAFVKELK